MKRPLLPILWVLLCLAFTGCAWFSSVEDKPAQELASDGMDYFRSGKYRNAIESFEKLKDWYPFSKYAILAELKIGDAYYQLEEYEEAIFAYEEFENLHPRNEAVPYVVYRIGRCYYNRIDTIDRDQTSARKAKDIFLRLIKDHPETLYAEKARGHIRTCYKSMAGNEFYVGLFYYKSKHYPAALSRFRAVLENFPDVGVHHRALKYITLSEAAIQRQAKSSE